MAEIAYEVPTGGSLIIINITESTIIQINNTTPVIGNGGIIINTENAVATIDVTVNINGITFGDQGGNSGYIDFSNATNSNNVLNFNGKNIIDANSATISSITIGGISAIRVPAGVTITINSGVAYNGNPPSLTCIGATGGTQSIGGAGIGGAVYESSGTITINNSAPMECTGGQDAAAIGGGFRGNGGTTTIELSGEGSLIANGGYEGAGIGGGMGVVLGTTITGGNGGSISITGPSTSILTAIGGLEAAGIGGGVFGDGGTITINGGITIDASSEYGGAGIGGGAGAATPTAYFGGGNGGTININSSGDITTNSIVGAGIGGGHLGGSGKITINTTGTVTANAIQLASGIGAGAGFVFGTDFGGGDAEVIILSGTGNITVNGGQSYDESLTPTELKTDNRYSSFASYILGGAGIGGGANGKGGIINISGALTVISNGQDGGAGIGGGTASTIGGTTYGGDVDSISIIGTTSIISTGGSNTSNIDGGAGIGGGALGSGGDISITDCENITATGNSGGAGVGGGYEGCYDSILIMNNDGVTANGSNGAENIGNGEDAPSTCDGFTLVSGPDVTGTAGNQPDLSIVQFIKNDLPYANLPVYLIDKENDENYQLTTNNQGQLYFYSNQGTYSFEQTSGNQSLEQNSFTWDNVPEILKFIRVMINKIRGINIFNSKNK